MRKLIIFLALTTSWFANYCYCEEISYTSFNSPQEIVEYETRLIEQIEPNDYSALSEAFINRGETYLFWGKSDLGLKDLDLGYEYALLCEDNERNQHSLRALFDLLFIYASLGKLDNLYSVSEKLHFLLACKAADNGNVPIYGPERIPIEDCIENSQGIARAARELIVFVKKPEIQFTLSQIIYELEAQAIRCCYAGGVWKGCLQPLANKYHQWNQKWKVFGIPPDPTWD